MSLPKWIIAALALLSVSAAANPIVVPPDVSGTGVVQLVGVGKSPAYPPWRPTRARIWDTRTLSNTTIFWGDIETARGVYNWSGIDQIVSALGAAGMTNLIFQMIDSHKTPAWTQAVPNPNAPPDNNQDACDFFNAMTSRFSGLPWTQGPGADGSIHPEIDGWEGNPNEYNINALWPISTVVALQHCLFTDAHANNPHAYVLEPPTTNLTFNGASGEVAYIQAGGDAYTDWRDWHEYFAQSSSSNFPADQVFYDWQIYQLIYQETGVSTTKPTLIGETGCLNLRNYTVNQCAAMMAIALAGFASQGANLVSVWNWGGQNSLTVSGGTTLSGPLEMCGLNTGSTTVLKYCTPPTTQFGDHLSFTGTVWANVTRWLKNMTFDSPITRQVNLNPSAISNDNLNPNPNPLGSSDGSVGQLPACSPPTGVVPFGWAAGNQDCANGVETDIAGSGIDAPTGLHYVNWRLHGTFTGPGATFTSTGSGTNLTVAPGVINTIFIGQIIPSGNGIPANTVFVSQTSGPGGCSPVGQPGCAAGVDGVYVTNNATTISNFSKTIVTKGFAGLGGTPTGTSSGVPASFGQFFYSCVYIQWVGGTWNGITTYQLKGTQYAGNTSISDFTQTQFGGWLPQHGLKQICSGGLIDGFGATNATQNNVVAYSAGVPFDITLRLAYATLDTKSLWTAGFSKPDGTFGQMWWDEKGVEYGGISYIPLSNPLLTCWESARGFHGVIGSDHILPVFNGMLTTAFNKCPKLHWGQVSANDNHPAMLRKGLL